MSIDDIDYLKQNSFQESFIFYVDSNDRDKRAYLKPSDYSISFEQPFRNVYGFEIIDASIPRTEYNVNSCCNTIRFSVDNQAFKTVTIPEGDYNSETLIEKLNGVLIDTSSGSKSIELENIRSYDEQKIEFPRGITLFEGDIGSGKSTILNMIPRIYSPLKGEITIDKQNIAEVNLESLRKEI